MVDFQSREPRTRGEDDETEPEAESESEPEEPAEMTAGEIVDQSPSEASLSYAVVTVSSQRSISEDTQGDSVVEAIEAAGDTVTTRDLIQPSYDGVQSTATTLAERSDVDAIVTIGGTGVEPDDVTVDALERLFEKQLPGFGELFRRLAYERLGSAVIGTRTTAGIIADSPVFAVPGALDGTVLAVEEIVVPEAPSLVDAAGGPDTERNS